MQLLPVVGRDTCLDIERRCIEDREAADFIRDVLEIVRKQNPRIFYFLDHLFFNHSHLTEVRVPSILAVSQLYKAFDIEMVEMPKISRAAFHIVDIRFRASDSRDYWQRKRSEFNYGNKELSRVLGITAYEGVRTYPISATQMVFDLALSVYVLLEIQREIDLKESTQIQLISR